MLFRNIFLKTMRDQRVATLSWGIGIALIIIIGASQYTQLIQGAGAARAQSVAEVTKAFQAFSFLLGEITSLGTIGGFLTTRVLGVVPVMLSAWALIAGAGLIRGEEQQGALDMLLSTPQARSHVLLQKVSALLSAQVLVAALCGLGIWAGTMAAGEGVSLAVASLTALNMLTIIAFWGAAGLFAGQLAIARRTASGAVAGIMLATFLLNNIFEGTPSLKGLSWLMPFHYYSLSKPLVEGRIFEVGAWLVLLAATALLLVLTWLLFTHRDIGAAFSLLPQRRAGHNNKGGSPALLGSVFGKSIRDLLGPTIAWGLGLGLYGILISSTVNEAQDLLREFSRGEGWIAKIIGSMATAETYLSLALFFYVPILLAVFAITQIDSWASEEEEGRVEMLVAMPVARWRVLAARYAAAALSLVVMLSVLWACVVITCAAANVQLDGWKLAASLFAALPLALVVLAFGLCVATWRGRPGLAMPLTIGVVIVMFFLETLAPLLSLPDWVLNLSIFHLYGKPLTEGVKWGGFFALTAATVALAFGSLVGMQRRDIAK